MQKDRKLFPFGVKEGKEGKAVMEVDGKEYSPEEISGMVGDVHYTIYIFEATYAPRTTSSALRGVSPHSFTLCHSSLATCKNPADWHPHIEGAN